MIKLGNQSGKSDIQNKQKKKKNGWKENVKDVIEETCPEVKNKTFQISRAH